MGTYTFTGDAISGSVDIDDPYAPVTLVTERFAATLAQAQDVLELLIGVDGAGGLIGDMETALKAAPATSITAPTVNTALILETSGQTLPTFDRADLIDAPTDTYTAPTLVAVPTINVDFTGAPGFPEELTLAMTWAEATLPTEVFTALRTQILADLVDGSTGITSAVETAIYTRARNRQQADRLAAYNRINNTAAQLQHAFPTSVLASALADFEIGANRQDAEIEAAIIEGQAKLAQENRKSAIQGAIALEGLLRQTRTDESGRALDSAKALEQLALQQYTEQSKQVAIYWEGKKTEVQALSEQMRGAIETNKGLIDIFSKQYESLKIRSDAAASYNKSLTDVFQAEAQGFGEVERAVAARNDSNIKLLEQTIANADMDLRGQIAKAGAIIQGYTSEMSIKERITADRVQIAAQVAASLLSAVNASASIGYSGSESASKSYGIDINGSESHSYQEV
jgi:hypothetical protein